MGDHPGPHDLPAPHRPGECRRIGNAVGEKHFVLSGGNMFNATLASFATVVISSGVCMLSTAAEAAVIYTFQQGVNGYEGTADSYVDDDTPTVNNGDATSLAGLKNDSEIFIRFDDIFGTGTGQIDPATASSDVVSATLTLQVIQNGNRKVDFNEITTSWTESGITWNLRPSIGTLRADDVSIPNEPGFFTVDLTDSIKAYLSGTTNNGWRIKDFGGAGANAFSFSSSEAGTAANRPLLTVEVVPEPAALSLLALAVPALTGRRRWS
jgi:hypothetical protein